MPKPLTQQYSRTRLLLLAAVLLVFVIIFFNTTALYNHNQQQSSSEIVSSPRVKQQRDETKSSPIKKPKKHHQSPKRRTEAPNDEDQHQQHQDHDHDHDENKSEKQPTIITLDFSSEDFVHAWKTSSKRETHETKISFSSSSSSSLTNSKVTFYGKSSLKISYTARRSIQVQVDDEKDGLILNDRSLSSSSSPPTIKIKNFVLLSLWEDTYRLAYRSSAILLKRLGLFYPQSSLVEVRCSGKLANSICHHHNDHHDVSDDDSSSHYSTLGVYLAIEYPSDAIIRTLNNMMSSNDLIPPKIPCSLQNIPRNFFFSEKSSSKHSHHSTSSTIHVATRNWFYFEKPANYDLLSVPKYKRDSPLSPIYREIEKDPIGSMNKQHFLLDQYLVWLVVNTALKNGDYDDEVFFWGVEEGNKDDQQQRFSQVGIMAWDYDNVFSPCHRKGKQAVKSNLIFCGETPIEKKIAKDTSSSPNGLRSKYEQVASCLFSSALGENSFPSAVDLALEEFKEIVNQKNGKYKNLLMEATFFDAKTDTTNKKKSKSSSPSSSSRKKLSYVEEGAEYLKNEFRKNRETLMKILPKYEQPRDIAHDEDDKEDHTTNSEQKSEKQDEKDEQHQDKHKHNHETEVVAIKKSSSSSSLLKINSNNKHQNSDNDDNCLTLKKQLSKLIKAEYRMQLPSLKASGLMMPHENKIFAPEAIEFQFGLLQSASGSQNGDDEHEKTEISQATEGLHCVVVKVNNDKNNNHCGDDDSNSIGRPIVVRSRERGKAEFGVNHHDITPLSEVYRNQKDTNSDDKAVKIITPKIWLKNSAFPIVVRFHQDQNQEDQKSSWDRSRSVSALSIKTASSQQSFDGLIIRGFGAVLLRVGRNDDGEQQEQQSLFPHRSALLAENEFLTLNNNNRLQPPVFIDLGDEKKVQVTTIPSHIADSVSCSSSSSLSCVCKPESTLTKISSGGSLTISGNCLLVMPPNGIIEVEEGGKLELKGEDETHPVAVVVSSSSSSNSFWKSLSCSGASSSISLEHVIVMNSGVQRSEKEMKSSHYKHHTNSPSILAEDQCKVVVKNSYFIGLKGPAFAASSDANVLFEDTLVQFAELGGECVFCDFASKNSAWTHFAGSPSSQEDNFMSTKNNKIPYEDNDNDGLYLSGGNHLVEGSVIARTHDDGIDSGISEHPLKSGKKKQKRNKSNSNENNIKIINTIIEDVFHEGIAFSSTPTGKRSAIVENCLIQRTQQGLEMGYSGKNCIADISNTILRNNQVGVRFGDNYYKRDQEGFISCDNCTFEGNDVNVVNFVRKFGHPHHQHSKIKIRNSKFSEKNSKIVRRDQFHCREVFEAFEGEENRYF